MPDHTFLQLECAETARRPDVGKTSVRSKILTLSAFALVLTACSSLVGTEESAQLTVHTFRLQYANTHLVTDGKNAFLFDAGFPDDAEKLVSLIREKGVQPEKLRAVIVSHGHHDHAGSAAYFQSEFAIPIIAGAGDQEHFDTGKTGKLCPVGFFARQRHAKEEKGTFPPFKVDIAVSDEIDLKPLTGIEGKIVALPGHTQGSLVVEAGKVALVGDLLRGEIFRKRATTHFFMCDIEDNRRDIVRLLNEIAPDAEQFFTGHFGAVNRASVREMTAPAM